MNYRVSQKVLLIFCLLTLAAVVAFVATQIQIFFTLTVAFFIAGFAQGLIFYRCPKCRRQLLRHGRKVPEKCPHCGKEL